MLRMTDAAVSTPISLLSNDLPQAMSAGQVRSPFTIIVTIARIQVVDRHISERCDYRNVVEQRSRSSARHRWQNLSPVSLSLGPVGEPSALICGPTRSGRTSTLHAVAHQLLPERAAC